jgi:hypothetical protein
LHTGSYIQRAVNGAPSGYTDLLAGYLTSGGTGIEISKVNWEAVNLAFPSRQKFTLDLSLVDVGSGGRDVGALPKIRITSSVVRRPGVFAVIDMPKPGPVKVELLDIAGRRVRELWTGPLSLGSTPIRWDLRDESGGRVSPGVMFVRLRSENHSDVRRLILLR